MATAIVSVNDAEIEGMPKGPVSAGSTPTRIPVELYLHTSYRPDREYVDGYVLERNAGEIPHATLQGFFAWLFRSREGEWRPRALPEQRVQAAETRFRIPDICVVPLRIDDKRIIRTAPLLCIEVLSWEDRMGEMQERVDDYLRMGVQIVWLIDPRRRRAFVTSADGVIAPVTDRLSVPGTPVEVPVADVFAELERYQDPLTGQ